MGHLTSFIGAVFEANRRRPVSQEQSAPRGFLSIVMLTALVTLSRSAGAVSAWWFVYPAAAIVAFQLFIRLLGAIMLRRRTASQAPSP